MTLLSYASGSSDKPLNGDSIGRYFDAVCDAHPDGLAVISCHQRIRWTYRELRERVDALASGLLAAGLQPGDRIGIWAPNCAEWLVTQYAAAVADRQRGDELRQVPRSVDALKRKILAIDDVDGYGRILQGLLLALSRYDDLVEFLGNLCTAGFLRNGQSGIRTSNQNGSSQQQLSHVSPYSVS